MLPSARPEIIRELGAIVLDDPKLPADGIIDPFAFDASRMAAAWANLGPAIFAAGDVLFLSSLTAPYLTGLIRHLAAEPEARRPRVVMRVYDGAMLIDSDSRGFSRQAAAWRRAMAEITDLPVACTMVSETPALARMTSRLLGCRVLHVPSPVAFDVTLPAHSVRSPWDDRPSPRVLFIYHSRGIAAGDLVRTLAQVRRARPDASLLVKLNDDPEVFSPAEQAAIVRGLGVPVLAGFLPQDALMRLADEADLMVLPYPIGSYEFRSSGPHLEAAGAGRPLVVPVRTWMAAEMEAGRAAGIVFARHTAEAVGGAVIGALDRLPDLRRRAEAARGRLFAHHGSRLFTHAVLAAAAGAPAADGVATDDRVTFDRLGDGARLLGRGWGAAAMSGTAMAGRSATLNLALEPPVGNAHAIDIVVEMTGPATALSVTANGLRIADWDLPATSVSRRVALRVPASRRLRLTFAVPATSGDRPTLHALAIRPRRD